MKITIKETKENPLLKRREIDGIIEHDGMPTPSKAAVQKVLAKELKEKTNHVDIRKIFTGTGKQDSRLLAFIWKEKEVPILEEKVKEKPKEEPKKEEKAKEKEEEEKKPEPKKEKEPEEKKEEPKEEKPKVEKEEEVKKKEPKKEPEKKEQKVEEKK